MTICVSATDCLYGRPAAGIAARLARKDRDDGGWNESARGRADDQGCVHAWDPAPQLERGTYRVELDLDSYFSTIGVTPFMPTATVTFRVLDPDGPCQIALFITPYASSACRLS